MTTKEIEIQIALGTLSRNNKVMLARNKRTAKRILFILSTDKDDDIREYIASNHNTPIGVLKKLSTDDYWPVRWRVAKNPNTPIDILRKLSTDKEWVVRHSVPHTLNMIGK